MNHKSKTKRIIFWLLAVFVIVGAVWGMMQAGGNSQSEGASLLGAVEDADMTKGNQHAVVTLVEYSDFQCAACGAYYPLLKQVSREYGENVRFVYRHFPLSQIHANAEPAARAAEAAGKQGKFWEMHDMIFEHQSEWSAQFDAREIFLSYARKLGLDEEKFAKDVDSREVKDKVARDYKSGIDSAVNATPTFFLNGKKIQNPRSYDEFKALLDRAQASS